MKNTKEIKTLLCVLYYLNQTGAKDRDIRNVLEYAFHRVFNCNTNMLLLACMGLTKEQAFPEIMKLLKNDTEYEQYLKWKEALK